MNFIEGLQYICVSSLRKKFTKGQIYNCPTDSYLVDDEGQPRIVAGSPKSFVRFYTIKDLKEGRVAVSRDTSISSYALKTVLVKAFKIGKDVKTFPNKYYFSDGKGAITGSDTTDLPVQSTWCFRQQLKKGAKKPLPTPVITPSVPPKSVPPEPDISGEIMGDVKLELAGITWIFKMSELTSSRLVIEVCDKSYRISVKDKNKPHPLIEIK